MFVNKIIVKIKITSKFKDTSKNLPTDKKTYLEPVFKNVNNTEKPNLTKTKRTKGQIQKHLENKEHHT